MKNKLLLITMGFALFTQLIIAQVPTYAPTIWLVVNRQQKVDWFNSKLRACFSKTIRQLNPSRCLFWKKRTDFKRRIRLKKLAIMYWRNEYQKSKLITNIKELS